MRKYIENNGIILKKNVDSNGNLFAVKITAEHKQIYKSTVMLEGVPSEFHRVFIEGYTENIPHRADLPLGTFNVDYNNGKVYFNPEEEGKFVVAEYYSIGTELIKAERVITKYLEGENFCVSFAEEIRQNQELKDALLKELEENPKIRIVESSEWVHEVESDLEQSFLIDDTIFNPVTDLITVFYNGDFLHGNKYTKVGCRIILKDWEANKGDVFSFIIYKHVVGTIEIGGDGSLIIDGSIGRHKLSEDIREDLDILPLHGEQIKAIEERLAKIDQDIVALGENIEENKTNIEEVKTNGSDVAKELKKDIEDTIGDFESLKEKIDDLEEKSMNINDIILGGAENRTVRILNEDNEMVALINKDQTSFNYMDIAKLTCPNAILKQDALTLYVDATNGDDSNDGLTKETAFKTIMKAINCLDKFLNGNVIINVSEGSYIEKVSIQGFLGQGTLSFNFSENVVITGEIYIGSCTSPIRINGNKNVKTVLNHTTTKINAVGVFTSQYIILDNFVINGNDNTKYCVNINQGTSMSIKNSELYNSTTSAIVAFECSKGYVINCIGTNHSQYSIYSGSGSTICIANTIPDAPEENWNLTGMIYGTAVKTSGESIVEKPEVFESKNYTSTNQCTYRAVGNRQYVYQGKYDSKNGDNYLHYGMYILDSDKMRSELSGKTIKAVNLTVKRFEEGQGIGQPILANLKFWGSTAKNNSKKPTLLSKEYITIKDVKKGSTVTVEMPNNFIEDVLNNNVNSLVLFTADGSSYCRMDDLFDLEVIYK